MAVADHELDAAQTPPRQRAQEGRPERLGLGRTDLEAEHLATPVGVDANSDYYGNGHDPPGLAHFHVVRVDPQIRPRALDRPIEERLHTLVDLCTEPVCGGGRAEGWRVSTIVLRRRLMVCNNDEGTDP